MRADLRQRRLFHPYSYDFPLQLRFLHPWTLTPVAQGALCIIRLTHSQHSPLPSFSSAYSYRFLLSTTITYNFSYTHCSPVTYGCILMVHNSYLHHHWLYLKKEAKGLFHKAKKQSSRHFLQPPFFPTCLRQLDPFIVISIGSCKRCLH